MLRGNPRHLIWLMLVMALLSPLGLNYTCDSAISNGKMNDHIYKTCYEQHDEKVAGRVHGSLTNCFASQCGSWLYNYNLIYYKYSHSTTHSWNYNYHRWGNCDKSGSCCCGCGRNCYSSYSTAHYDYWGNYWYTSYHYNWRDLYYADDNETVAIY